ncbi:MAG: outer membrane beta-barrel protein [Bacteroidales bacterium]
MKRLILLFAFAIFTQLALAQSFTIKGRLTDTNADGLPNATLLLLKAADSTMVNYALTSLEGDFEIRNVAREDHFLRISYVGYATLNLLVEPPAGPTLALGKVQLKDERTLLREVIVQEERIPMRVRGDTIEYDALAFRIQPNEVVEDLLKRMPGIEIQSDGSVIAQGEQVRRVLVDGREFFGRDPKMATQNLPADAVSKVHVFDERSEQARFSGIDDGQRERTMNLELKEDRKEGLFGNTSLGYGPDDRFQGRTNLNRFDSKGQISILGMGNNLNQQGFSIGEYMNFSGGVQSLMGGGGAQITMGGPGNIPINMDGRPGSNGIMTSWAGGFNVNRKLWDRTDVSASYFYNQLDHDVDQDLERENFLPTGNYDFRQISVQENLNWNHRLNLRVDHKINDNNSLLLTAASTLNATGTYQQSDSQTLSAAGEMQNASQQVTNAEGQQLNVNSSLLWRKRFSVPGRTLTTGLDLASSGNSQDGSLEAVNRFMRDFMLEERIMQTNTQESLNRSLGFNASYTEPLGNRRYLEANYRITQNLNEIDQQVYDLVDGQPVINTLLTNIYNNTYLYQRGGINFRLNRDMYNLTVGSSVQATSLKGEIVTRELPIERNYFNVLPVVRFNYEFSNMRRFSADFETNVQEPSLLQLQPIIDNRDPLNLYEGNPDLRPSYRNRASLRYNTFNPLTSFGFFTFFTADYVTNAITNSVRFDEDLVRTVTPVNTENNLNLRGNFNVNFGLEKLKSRLMAGTTLSRVQSTNILNDVSQRIVNNTLTGNLRYNFRPGEQFDAVLSATVSQQLTDYAFSALEQAYLNQTYSAEANWNFLQHYRLNLGYRYQVYQGATSDFDQKIPLLDFGFSRRFLKGNAGELRLTGYNLLNQDLGVTQSVDANYLQRQVTNSLGRYFLLTFTYSLNRSLNVMDGGHGPGRGMRMIMH